METTLSNRKAPADGYIFTLMACVDDCGLLEPGCAFITAKVVASPSPSQRERFRLRAVPWIADPHVAGGIQP